MNEKSQISLVEPHDGRFARLEVLLSGRAEVHFNHLSVYRPVRQSEQLRYEVASHSAVLRLQGVNSLVVSGPLTGDDYISEGIVRNAEGQVLPWCDALGEVRVTGLILQMGSGTLIKISCLAAELELSEQGEVFEEWEGPLQAR
jgi:hypothetical protein